MPRRYATNTRVTPERSQNEIQNMLKKYGATGFGFMEEDGRQVIMFRIEGYTIRYKMTMPSIDDMRTPTGFKPRYPEKQHRQEVNRLWRVLVLAIKAKLELVAVGQTTIQEEFLSSIVTYDGRTVGEHIIPQLASGKATKLTLALGDSLKRSTDHGKWEVLEDGN